MLANLQQATGAATTTTDLASEPPLSPRLRMTLETLGDEQWARQQAEHTERVEERRVQEMADELALVREEIALLTPRSKAARASLSQHDSQVM